MTNIYETNGVTLLTVAQASQIAKVSVMSVHRWIKEGKLSAERSGYQYLIKESDLTEWLAVRSSKQKKKV